jgi:crossover junction endodeoxyribonuclease RuvC
VRHARALVNHRTDRLVHDGRGGPAQLIELKERADLMRVLGLDPGSRKTGWGVVERRGREFHCLGAGHVAPSARMELPQRLHAIVRDVDLVMERFTPDVVVVEAAFHHEFARSTLVLGQIRGALLVAAVDRGLPVAEYAPRAIKLAVTGRGGAAKAQVAAMVQLQLRLAELPQADAADALAGALCHLRRAKFDAPRRRTPAGERLAAMLATSRSGR